MNIIEGASPREAELEEQNAALEDMISKLRQQSETLLAALHEAQFALEEADGVLEDVMTDLRTAIQNIRQTA